MTNSKPERSSTRCSASAGPAHSSTVDQVAVQERCDRLPVSLVAQLTVILREAVLFTRGVNPGGIGEAGLAGRRPRDTLADAAYGAVSHGELNNAGMFA